MKRLAAIAAATAMIGGVAATADASKPHHGTKVQLVKTSLGSILANSRGFTLYMFTRDHGDHDSCVGVPGCTALWPVLVARGRSIAGPGVKRSLLGSIKLKSGMRQVTYAGHPLYTYSADSGPRSTSYVGISQFGGAWYALSASGAIVK